MACDAQHDQAPFLVYLIPVSCSVQKVCKSLQKTVCTVCYCSSYMQHLQQTYAPICRSSCLRQFMQTSLVIGSVYQSP